VGLVFKQHVARWLNQLMPENRVRLLPYTLHSGLHIRACSPYYRALLCQTNVSYVIRSGIYYHQRDARDWMCKLEYSRSKGRVYHGERVAFNTIVALLYTLLYTANCTVLEDLVPLRTVPLYHQQTLVHCMVLKGRLPGLCTTVLCTTGGLRTTVPKAGSTVRTEH